MFRNQARGTENKSKKEFVNVRRHIAELLFDTADKRLAGSASLRLSQAFHGTCLTMLSPGHIRLTDSDTEQIRPITRRT